MHGINKRKNNKTTKRQRRVGWQQRHIKGRERWYDNNSDSDSYNSIITIGGGDRDGEENSK